VGVGLILAAVIMLAAGSPAPAKEKIESLAREMGMVYPQEVVFECQD